MDPLNESDISFNPLPGLNLYQSVFLILIINASLGFCTII